MSFHQNAVAGSTELESAKPISVWRLVDRAANLLLAFLLLIGAARALEVWRLCDALVDDVARFSARRWERPALVDHPSPGTFGENLSRILEERRQAGPRAMPAQLPEDCTAALLTWRVGVRIGTLPDHCAADADARLPEALTLVSASFAERGGPPDRAGGKGWRRDPASWPEVSAANEVLLFSAAVRASDGRSDEALALCTDVLALARDLAIGNDAGSIWSRISALGGARLLCGDAINTSNVEARRKMLVALYRLRDGQPTFADAVKAQSLRHRLELFSIFLTEAQRARLPDAESSRLSESSDNDMPLRFLAMPRLERFEARRMEAAQRPSSYSAEMKRLEAALKDSWNPWLREPRALEPAISSGVLVTWEKADNALNLLIGVLEVSLDPSRLWEHEAEFRDDGQVRLWAPAPNQPGVPMQYFLRPDFAQPLEPGEVLRLTGA